MTNEDILNELLIEIRNEGIFDEVVAEINKIKEPNINSNNRLELFEKAISHVRRNKTV
jgi:hypothetical protein